MVNVPAWPEFNITTTFETLKENKDFQDYLPNWKK